MSYNHTMSEQVKVRNSIKRFSEKTLNENTLLYPNENVIRFLSRCTIPINATGLDIGFGSGQHLELMMNKGIQVSGVELIETTVRDFKLKHSSNPLLKKVIAEDFLDLEFTSEFDFVVVWGVIFISPKKKISAGLNRIFQAMKPNGKLCINFRTKDNWIYGLGKKISEDHFILDERAKEYCGAYYTFLDEYEARSLLVNAGFEIDYVERYDYYKNNLSEKNSWWSYSCSKKVKNY